MHVVKEWKVLEGSWQYSELGSAYGMVFGSLRGKVKVIASVGGCLDQDGILRKQLVINT